MVWYGVLCCAVLCCGVVWCGVLCHAQKRSVCFVMAEVVSALEHIHARGVVYGDLKPENILIHASGHCKVLSFLSSLSISLSFSLSISLSLSLSISLSLSLSVCLSVSLSVCLSFLLRRMPPSLCYVSSASPRISLCTDLLPRAHMCLPRAHM